MEEKCNLHCDGLTRLEQEVADLRKQNGIDHKEFRDQIKEIEMEDARQAERFQRIMDSLIELKKDNKELLERVSNNTVSQEEFKKLEKDVEELKAKPGKRWEAIVGQIISIVVAVVIGFVFGKIGLQ